jgi:hypothetical protein
MANRGGNVTNIDELKNVIRKRHRVEATHSERVPVKETFQGETVWDGVVEVFDLIRHPYATKVYAWTYDTNDLQNPRRHVTVLNIDPIVSPRMAVRAEIIQEFTRRQRKKGS